MLASSTPENQTAPASPRQEQRLRMSYEAYLAWADEDIHAEWVNGEVIVYMPPKIQHQRVVRFLLQLLSLFTQLCRSGEVLVAPS
jgi:Uma2 family endonuclease